MRKLTVILSAALVLASAGAVAQHMAAPRLEKGYLDSAPAPGLLGLLPPPPAPGSPDEARDQAASTAGLALRGGPRWMLAIRDADIFAPDATSTFACAAGRSIGSVATPKTEALLRRSLTDLALSGALIKRTYKRARPFMVNGQSSCTPDSEAMLRGDGSYPSGHSAIGYGWALILAQLLPERSAMLLSRGIAFGDSRRVCNVHWLSDVEGGRVTATMTVARLNADPGFRADLEAASIELRSTPMPPVGCDAEAAALKP